MPVAAALGDTLVGLDELDGIAASAKDEVEDFLNAQQVDRDFILPVGDGLKLGATELEKARMARATANPYQGIGFGKPLTIVLETIYVGDYPDALAWFPGNNEGDILVTSANKAFQVFAAAPRSVHLLEPRAGRRSFLRASASREGSQVVHYSPAVDAMSILFSVELSSDRDIDEQLGKSFAKAVSTAGALPVLAPAAPYLVAAGAVIPIAVKAAQMLSSPRTFFAESAELNFGRPGCELTQPGELVLYPRGHEGSFTRRYKLGSGRVLHDVVTGKQYDGPLPYIVISLDGSTRSDLSGWSAQAASAELLERFIQPDERITSTLEIVTEGLSLYNDMLFRDRAAKALEGAAAATGAEKKKYEEHYKAYVKNIQNKEIRGTIDKHS